MPSGGRAQPVERHAEQQAPNRGGRGAHRAQRALLQPAKRRFAAPAPGGAHGARPGRLPGRPAPRRVPAAAGRHRRGGHRQDAAPLGARSAGNVHLIAAASLFKTCQNFSKLKKKNKKLETPKSTIISTLLAYTIIIIIRKVCRLERKKSENTLNDVLYLNCSRRFINLNFFLFIDLSDDACCCGDVAPTESA